MTWTSESVRQTLMDVFGKHAQDGAEPTYESHLVADLGIDSLGQMEVIADIEDVFGLRIDDEKLREIETIGSVAGAIEAQLKSEGRFQET